MSLPPAPGASAYARQSPLPHWPILRKKQVFVVPLISIIVGALLMCFLIGITVVQTPTIGILAVLLSAAAAIVGILLLVWLDRWEPEPPHLLVTAFFWGGGVSLVMVLIGSFALSIVGGNGDFFATVISAPLVEESAKGLFLVLVLLTSRRGRAEFNSLTDALVYAGFVGIGFSFVEDILYIAGEATLGGALTLAGIRLGLGAFSHSVYTAMTAIGLWLGLNARGAMQFVWPFIGWCVAVLLHAIHNGSTFLGVGAYLLSLLVFTLPAFIVFVVLAVRSYREEGRIVASQLPVMGHNGWITPQQANWLGNLRGRKQAVAYARTQGRQERLRIASFRDTVTELAYVRHRLDRMGPPYSPDLVTQHDHLVGLLNTTRQWVGEHLQPQPPAWHPVHTLPGREYHLPPPPGLAGQPYSGPPQGPRYPGPRH